MKKLLGLLIAVLCIATASLAAKTVHVKGYTKKDGTYVAPHIRTSPNKTKNDNYSTRGNINPYTGKEGKKPRDGDASSALRAPAPSGEKQATQAGESVAVGWSAVKSGMSVAELKHQLGPPRSVEGKTGFEIWTYPAGTIFVKEDRVVAWKQDKSR